MIRVQTEDFDLNAQVAALSIPTSRAALSSPSLVWCGTLPKAMIPPATMTLEHYPGMTENQLADIEQDARTRWDLHDVTIIHRVGTLSAGSKLFWFWPVRATGKTPLMRPISSWIF